jgi:tRNA (guanine37-N1)-methyltransferase
MTISILTLFPQMFVGPFDQSIIKRAQQNNLLTIEYIDIRNFSKDKYKSVDDHPYGGGHGMVLRVDIIDDALTYVKNKLPAGTKTRTILMDPQGAPYTQQKAQSLSQFDHLILICGHYEGVDERVRLLVDEEISIGDYVLTGGEIPASVIVDSVVRLLPGVLSKEVAPKDESFSGDEGILEHPQYTRPPSYKSMDVPDVLLSGDHKKITDWRLTQAKSKTKSRRPDLLKSSN